MEAAVVRELLVLATADLTSFLSMHSRSRCVRNIAIKRLSCELLDWFDGELGALDVHPDLGPNELTLQPSIASKTTAAFHIYSVFWPTVEANIATREASEVECGVSVMEDTWLLHADSVIAAILAQSRVAEPDFLLWSFELVRLYSEQQSVRSFRACQAKVEVIVTQRFGAADRRTLVQIVDGWS